MSAIRIRVGASLDASVATVFGQVGEYAAKARKRVTKESQVAGDAIGPPMRRGAKDAEAAFAKLASEVSGQGSKMMTPATKGITDFARESKARFSGIKGEFAALAATAEAEMKRVAKAEASAASGGGGGGGGNRFGRRVGYWAVRNFSPVTPTLSMGKRLAGDVARGVGLPTDVSSYVQSFVERQKVATDIANSGFIEGAKGPAGQRQDPNAIRAESLAVAKSTGVGAEEAQDGLQKFTSFTGDLATGREILSDMAKLSVATGASMEDVVGAAGKISKNLGDVPNKGAAINAIMLKLAGMGKIGATEIRDFGAELSKLAPMANRFGGDRQANLGKMGVLMQLAQAGGAKGASQASTAAVRFVETFTKAPNIKAWGKMFGTNEAGTQALLFNKDKSLRDPRELLMQALDRTKGDQIKMGTLFKSGPAKQVIEPMLEAYNSAGGGAKGAQSAAAVYDQLAKAGMSVVERDKELAIAQETTANQVARFKTTLQETADTTMANLLPALEKLAPQIESAVGAFGGLVTWAAGSPMEAVVLALGAAITKATLENVLRSGIEKMFEKATAKEVLTGAFAPAAAIMAAAVVGWKIGTLIIESFDEYEQKKQKKAVAGDLDVANVLGSNDPEVVRKKLEELKALKPVEDPLSNKLEKGALRAETIGKEFFGLVPQGTTTETDKAYAAADAARLQANTDSTDRLTARLDALLARSGVLGTNTQPAPVKADPSGRTPVSLGGGPRGISYGGG